ncbi:MAG: hypothetical protein SFW36_18420, partial [Leptolyngbyaceae cyanobacterium bins.59]|nr:hypothetical protein [Leptolyngbyaceae cyanobacterium bins.59]
LTALLRPTLIRIAIQHPIHLVHISSLLISGPLVLAAPVVFLHRSDTPVFLIYSQSYLLFLAAYTVLCAISILCALQPRIVTQFFRYFQSPRQAIRIVSGTAIVFLVAFGFVIFSHDRLMATLGRPRGAYLMIYLVALIGCALVGLLKSGLVWQRWQAIVGQSSPISAPMPVTERVPLREWISGALATVLGASILLSFSGIAGANVGDFRQLANQIRHGPDYVHLADLKQFPTELYMTNINTPTVGFFTKAPGYGVCGLETISEQGNVNQSECQVAFMRQYRKYNQILPRYFFFVNGFYPGFADCLPPGALVGQVRGGNECIAAMQDRLTKNFTRIFENKLIQVYDLHRRRS